MAWYHWAEGDTTSHHDHYHHHHHYHYHHQAINIKQQQQQHQPQLQSQQPQLQQQQPQLQSQQQQQQYHRPYRTSTSCLSDERMHYLDSINNINTDYYHNHHLRHYNHFWHPQRPPLKGTLVLFPPSWDTLTQCWKELAALGLNFSSRKRLILYFVFRGTSFRVCLGNAKAAGLLCVLGIGLGIGSLLIYRLFKKYQCSNDLPDKSGDECYVHLESVESVFNKEEMGHGYSSHDLPAAHYAPDTGVSFLLDSYKEIPNQEEAVHVSETPVRHRKLGPSHPSKDCCKSEALSAVDSDTKMLLTDDRWSESASGGDVQSQEEDGASISSCPQSFTSSLMGNYSPRSLRERNFMIENDTETSDRNGRTLKKPSCKEKSQQKNHHSDKVTISKNLKESSVLLTPPSEEDSSPSPYQPLIKKTKLLKSDPNKENANYRNSENYLNCNNKNSPDDVFDNSLFSELSFSSKSLSPPSRRDWSLDDDEEKDLLSPLCTSTSLDQFPQLLLRRLRECKSVSPESNRSGTPEDCLSPESQKDGIVLERCDSIDSSIFEIINDVPQQIEKEEVLRFHGIEDELQDLNDEMDDLMSGLSHLKSKCSGLGGSEETDIHRQMLLSEQAYIALQKARSHCGKRPGSLTPDSSTGDIQSPIDNFLSWDMTDFQLDGLAYDNESNVIAITNEQNYVPFSVDSDNNFAMSTPHYQFHNDNQNNPTTEGRQDMNIGPQQNLEKYIGKKWAGNSEVDVQYRHSASEVRKTFDCQYIRSICGDNYGGIRACIVTMLINGIAIRNDFDTAEKVKELLDQYMDDWQLNQWTFAGQLDNTDVKTTLFSCIDEFYSKYHIALQMNMFERENWVVEVLNSDPIVDIQIMETAKLLMLLDIINIYETENVSDFPKFVNDILARDLSATPAELLKNILNEVGDSLHLDLIDMCLLGHALGVIITVSQLHLYGTQDFIFSFRELPENYRDEEVLLIAEDDVHYNIII